MKYQLTIVRNPTGTYSYVGSIPLALATLTEPTYADAMAGRVVKVNGKWKSYRFPTFATDVDAAMYAQSKGFRIEF